MIKRKTLPVKTCVFVQMTRPECRYLLVERNESAPIVLAGGAFEVQTTSLAEELRDHLAEQNQRVRHAILLLPRSELESAALNLPPSSESELPALVQTALLQEQEDSDIQRVSDYLITHQDTQSTEVTAFSVDSKSLTQWTDQFKAAGMTLIGVTFSGTAPGEMLPSARTRTDDTNVVITVSDQDLDLVVSTGERPLLFRTVPWSTEDDHQLADRLAEEIPRTISLAHRLGEDDAPRVFLVGELSEFESELGLLSDLLSYSVIMVDPWDLVQSRTSLADASRYGNLVGIALVWNRQGLRLNFLAPRRPPAPASPLRKFALVGAAVAALLLGLGYQIYSARADQLSELEQRQKKYNDLVKRANKARGQKMLVDAVTQWRQDDVAWLDEWRRLSEQLPPSEQALVRKMNLMIDAQGQGVINLSVQVSKPEVVTMLEDALRVDSRSVSSNRVSESDEKSKLPWGFDTKVVFHPATPPDLPQFDLETKDGEASEKKSPTANSKQSSKSNSKDESPPDKKSSKKNAPETPKTDSKGEQAS